jgi:hypothetical protein
VVLSKEDVWEFGANTGKRVTMASGVQPLDKKDSVARDRLATVARPDMGTPAPINRLYDDETMAAMAKERIVRCPGNAQQSAATPAGRISGTSEQRDFGRRAQSKQPASVSVQSRGRFSR